jgi:hypothetical protein
VKNILASGVDSLVISSSIVWKDAAFFTALDEAKEIAKKYSHCQIQINHFRPEEYLPFIIKPHGAKGFSWILSNSYFTYKIANSEPGPRPNAMIEIRSETLWCLGPEEAVKTALAIIEANGGLIVETKLSRVDLCVDFLMPEKKWSHDLMKYAVTRATDSTLHCKYNELTGITIGKGIMSARLYDKPLEIRQQSRKYWMYDIWGIQTVPEGGKIIRIEFQLRREALNEARLKDCNDLFQRLPNAWRIARKTG